jgi:hypothetical protein
LDLYLKGMLTNDRTPGTTTLQLAQAVNPSTAIF